MSSTNANTNQQQDVRAYTSNGTPVSMRLDEMSIAERANLMPASWDHANVSVKGGHGITYARVHLHNGPGSGNTHNGAGIGTFGLVVALIIVGFLLYGFIVST